MKLHTALLIACTAGGLAACGGGDHDDYTPANNANQVPASASVSTTAYRQYVGSLMSSETATPLDVSTVDKPPTSESEAPAAI